MSHLVILASSQLQPLPLPPFSTPKSPLWSLDKEPTGSPEKLLSSTNGHVLCHEEEQGSRGEGFGGLASPGSPPSLGGGTGNVTDLH